MTDTSPLITTTTKVCADDVQDSLGGQGGGSGLPPESGGPAIVDTNSAHTSAHADIKRLMVIDSPLLVVSTLSAGFAGRTPHDTPVDPASFALWRTYHTSGRSGLAVALCLERMLLAETVKERACWMKDCALSLMAGGRHAEAFEMLRPVRVLASRYEGPFRGRLEVAFARAHENLSQYDPAFEHYTAGRFYAGADSYLAAQIDTNTGRCYTDAGRPEDAHGYFDRAYSFALKSGDVLLRAEVDESRACAYEADGDYAEALTCAAYSIYLLAPTNFLLARDESEATYIRIKGKAGAR
jgi:hypothetical protein